MLDRIVKAAMLEVFRARVRPEKLAESSPSFEGGLVVHTGEDIPSSEYAKLLGDARRHARRRSPTSGSGESPAGRRVGIEFVLEGLHLTKRLNKDAVGGRAGGVSQQLAPRGGCLAVPVRAWRKLSPPPAAQSAIVVKQSVCCCLLSCCCCN